MALLEPSQDPSNRPVFNINQTVNLRAQLYDQDDDSLTYTWKLRPYPESDLQTLFGGTATGASFKSDTETGTEILYSFSTDLLPTGSCALTGKDFEVERGDEVGQGRLARAVGVNLTYQSCADLVLDALSVGT